MAIAATLLAGAFFLVGAVVAWRVRRRSAIEGYSIAVAFGSLACVAALDLAPEAVEASDELGWLVAAVLVIGGVVALVALDHVAPGHHEEAEEGTTAHIGMMTVLAVSAHNVAEGAAIFTVASQDAAAGIALAVGVGLHNAPMGMLFYSTMERGRARGVAVLAAAVLSTFAGGVLMSLLGNVLDETVMSGVVCVALGMIAYILFVELLPAMVHRGDAKRSIIGVAVGVAFVLAGLVFEL